MLQINCLEVNESIMDAGKVLMAGWSKLSKVERFQRLLRAHQLLKIIDRSHEDIELDVSVNAASDFTQKEVQDLYGIYVEVLCKTFVDINCSEDMERRFCLWIISNRGE